MNFSKLDNIRIILALKWKNSKNIKLSFKFVNLQFPICQVFILYKILHLLKYQIKINQYFI
jgi:hypothetical protein